MQNGEILIVDEFTGRLMVGRRYSDGLHQAIEVKEKVKIKNESKTLATITFQNFFRMYEKLAGMTGTAKTEEAEFEGIYDLGVVEIPTHKPMIREDKPDVVLSTEAQKFEAVNRGNLCGAPEWAPVIGRYGFGRKQREAERHAAAAGCAP